MRIASRRDALLIGYSTIAMAGSYRVTFDFLEVTPFSSDTKRDRPYQSWGTERVYVDRDDGRFISLSHILVMRILQKDGSLSEPLVTKHWRQDWRYEPAEVVEYRGREQWARRVLKQKDVTGQWSQTVFQVDESPRYASVGKWQHTASFSSWISGDTWRPLPRREWSVRKDYQVLIGTNRHTIVPTGWIQEENNLKGVLDEQRALDAAKPYVAREYGVARYERLQAPDFGAADQYYESTKKFWDEVRDAWSADFRKQPVITLRAPVDQGGLFVPSSSRPKKSPPARRWKATTRRSSRRASRTCARRRSRERAGVATRRRRQKPRFLPPADVRGLEKNRQETIFPIN